jgi:hypothetical protein
MSPATKNEVKVVPTPVTSGTEPACTLPDAGEVHDAGRLAGAVSTLDTLPVPAADVGSIAE